MKGGDSKGGDSKQPFDAVLVQLVVSVIGGPSERSRSEQVFDPCVPFCGAPVYTGRHERCATSTDMRAPAMTLMAKFGLPRGEPCPHR